MPAHPAELTKGNPQIKLLLLPIETGWKSNQKCQPLLQLGHRFHHCRAGYGLLAGFQAVFHRSIGEVRLSVMLRQECRQSGYDLGKSAFQCRGNAGMQLLTSAAQ